MRLAMKLGRSLAGTTALAEVHFGEVGDGSDGGGIGVGRGDDFEQLHVARRIEEVCAEPATAQVRGQRCSDVGDGQAAGVGGEDRIGAADVGTTRASKARLISRFSATASMIQSQSFSFERSSSKLPMWMRAMKSGEAKAAGLDFFRPSRALAVRRIGVAGLGHVQQQHGKAGVGDVGCDAGAHGARAEHGDAMDGISRCDGLETDSVTACMRDFSPREF